VVGFIYDYQVPPLGDVGIVFGRFGGVEAAQLVMRCPEFLRVLLQLFVVGDGIYVEFFS